MNPMSIGAFFRLKPFCDAVMAFPTIENASRLQSRLAQIDKEILQEMQLYILFPVLTHLNVKEAGYKEEILRSLVDVINFLLNRVNVTSAEMFVKYHKCLHSLLFDKTKEGMVAEVSEELQLSVIESLTVLMVKLVAEERYKVFQNQKPLLAHTIFIAVHIAKREKLRKLRLSAISCVSAYTASHESVSADDDQRLEKSSMDMVASILPGVVSALYEVATSVDHPGHAVIVAALTAMRKIICVIMNDKYLKHNVDVTREDFAKLLQHKAKAGQHDVVETKAKDLAKRSPEWFRMAGGKLKLVTESVSALQTHEHVRVRMALAVYCRSVLARCPRTMQPSMPAILNVLVALSEDSDPEVSDYCRSELSAHFASVAPDVRAHTLATCGEHCVQALRDLPKTLSNIDSARKLSALNLVHGYIVALTSPLSAATAAPSQPQPLTTALSLHKNMSALCEALLHAAEMETDVGLLTQHAQKDVSGPVSSTSPWCRLRHIDDALGVSRLHAICRRLGGAECADLVVDQLLDSLDDVDRRGSVVCVLNWIAAESDTSLTRRVLNKYLERDLWHLPLALAAEAAISTSETWDVDVYDPRAWDKDAVPGLYEGAIEVRYTDIGYHKPCTPKARDPNYCATLAEAQSNMAVLCLLTEGVGLLARRLTSEFQPYLLNTLCLVLERVGNKYEMLHLAGLKAVHDITAACGHRDVGELIRCNADYFTYQVTTRLKKAWNSQSALQILSVVMEYSDASILDCLYGIVNDVLVQSCDKYHQNDLSAYLKVFLTFITCVHKWFPFDDKTRSSKDTSDAVEDFDIFKETTEYIKNLEESKKLVDDDETGDLDSGKTAEEMYIEDQEQKEEDEMMDCDDPLAEEKPPVPQHIQMTITILKRALNFIPSKRRDEKLLALQVIDNGLPLLRDFEDELLPLVHIVWSPLVARFGEKDLVVVRRALDVVQTMAGLSKDFIRNRCVKEVLPTIFAFLHTASSDSRLKDVGSAYRLSHAYRLQEAELRALPSLAEHLALEGAHLQAAMGCVDAYLSNRQPKPLQALAVAFFRCMLRYDGGAAWSHLRRFCGNEHVTQPPPNPGLTLAPVTGTPFEAADKSWDANLKAIFNRE